MFSTIKKFYNDESGATMVEYAIMVALIAVAVAAAVIVLQGQMSMMFKEVAECIKNPSTENACKIDGALIGS